ncbi:MAG TPA: BON domain-containing protein [Vicinamibacterales bacterium]|jgi:hyperosmotically inducible protein
MLRMMARVVLTVILIIVLVGFGTYVLGYWQAERSASAAGDTPLIDQRVRETGAEIVQGARVAGSRMADAVEDGALTAKIKSKMALDDYVKARDIDVDSSDGLITLTGKLQSEAEHERAVRLTLETEGVRTIIDALQVSGL